MSEGKKKPVTSVTVDRVQKPFPAPVDVAATVESIAEATLERDRMAVDHQMVRMYRELEYSVQLMQRYLGQLPDDQQDVKMDAIVQAINQLLDAIGHAVKSEDLKSKPALARVTNKHVVHVVPS